VVTSLWVCGSLSLHGAHSLTHTPTHKTHSVIRGLVGGLGGADMHLSLPKGKASCSPEHSRWAHTRPPEMRKEMRPWKSSKVCATTKKVLRSITNSRLFKSVWLILSFLRIAFFVCASCLILYLEMAIDLSEWENWRRSFSLRCVELTELHSALSTHTLQEVLTLQGIFNTLAHVYCEQTPDVFLLACVCVCVCVCVHMYTLKLDTWVSLTIYEYHEHYHTEAWEFFNFFYIFERILLFLKLKNSKTVYYYSNIVKCYYNLI